MAPARSPFRVKSGCLPNATGTSALPRSGYAALPRSASGCLSEKVLTGTRALYRTAAMQ